VRTTKHFSKILIGRTIVRPLSKGFPFFSSCFFYSAALRSASTPPRSLLYCSELTRLRAVTADKWPFRRWPLEKGDKKKRKEKKSPLHRKSRPISIRMFSPSLSLRLSLCLSPSNDQGERCACDLTGCGESPIAAFSLSFVVGAVYPLSQLFAVQIKGRLRRLAFDSARLSRPIGEAFLLALFPLLEVRLKFLYDVMNTENALNAKFL